MVSIGIQRNSENQVIGCHISGHAGYAEEGSDIICSSISSLTQAPVIGLEKHLNLHPSCLVNQEDGILEVALNSAPTDMTQAILMTMFYSVDSVARQCPQYVRIKEHRR